MEDGKSFGWGVEGREERQEGVEGESGEGIDGGGDVLMFGRGRRGGGGGRRAGARGEREGLLGEGLELWKVLVLLGGEEGLGGRELEKRLRWVGWDGSYEREREREGEGRGG